ncbi:phospholipase A1 member A-like [Bradysia coprophila]|uniref:phospholipase A1 member A-like n=1 Tax=Bradysia coprophila TaxID=38358 RepID=UPI00187DC432|nr:phospholipase A1 member A-like [Bradysia coprophila]
MKDQFVQFVLLGFMLVTTVHLRSNRNLYQQNIIFHGYDATGRSFTSSLDNDLTLLQHCIITDNVTIITHGWREESLRSIWARNMISNFSSVRGGCVFIMDYEYYSHGSYLSLYSHFKPITEVLTKKLLQLNRLGFDPVNFFLFGFSFGSHLVFEGAYQFGPRKVGRIDCCDPAGPLFPEYFGPALHARDSALFVQCVHTSSDKGTAARYCPININMGKCGQSQPGSTSRPHLSHGLCPVIYANAFKVDFSLVPVNQINDYFSVHCKSRKYTPDVRQLPHSTMGFRFNASFPLGEYFALTSDAAPYNVV